MWSGRARWVQRAVAGRGADEGVSHRTANELARALSESLEAYRRARAGSDGGRDEMESLEKLVTDAVERARRAGWGSVDHIVLAGTLEWIAQEVPGLAPLLVAGDWRWPS